MENEFKPLTDFIKEPEVVETPKKVLLTKGKKTNTTKVVIKPIKLD